MYNVCAVKVTPYFISRVHISANSEGFCSCEGVSFSKPAKLVITEEPTEHGKYWTWVHWELEVNTMDLFMATEVVCRAWDASQNTQPAALTWTLLGQGNNSMFRLRLHKDIDDKVCAPYSIVCYMYTFIVSW